MPRARRRGLTVHRFLVSPEAISGDTVILRGGEAYHAAVVLRLRAGERVVIIDGSGIERLVELTSVASDETTGRVLETGRPAAPRIERILMQGVPRGSKMDDIIRMGTELGVRVFMPVRTRRTVAQAHGRTERWRRIAAAAAKQSRRAEIPIVYDPQGLAETLDRLPPGTMLLVPWEEERARTMASVLRGMPRPAGVAILIGPEGGLDQDEVGLATARGGVPVSLGPLVLRTETAGMAALAMVLYEFGLRE